MTARDHVAPDDYRRQFDDAVHNLDLVRRRIREQKATLNDELPRLSASATSPDGAVEVTVTGDGILSGLNFRADARNLADQELAGLILSTYDIAQRKAASQAIALLQPVFGDHGPHLDRLRARQDAPPLAHPSAGAESASPITSSGADEDDDFDFHTMRA